MDSLRRSPKPHQSDDRFIATINRLALLIALVVALVVPIGYTSLEFKNISFRAEKRALVKGGAIATLVSGNPELWMYQLRHMEGLLADYPAPIDAELLSVHDAQGTPLVSLGDSPKWPLLRRTYQLHDLGRVVGWVEVVRSLRGLIYGAALATLLGMVLGGAVFGVLRTWPLRALRRMSVALEAEQAALRASEDRYRTVADFTYDWEYWLSPDGSLLYVSPSCLRVTGYQASEFRQDPGLLSRIVHPDDRQELDRHLHAVEKPETERDHYELDFRILARDGEVRWIAHICRNISDHDGKYLGRRACNRDITERKRMEQTLRARDERFRTLFDRASEGVVIVSPDGKVVAANESFARMHGYRVDEMLNMCLKDLDTPETLQLVPERMQRLRAGESMTFEVEHYHKDGRVFPLEVSASLVFSDGQTLIQSFHRDITERRRAEAQRTHLETQLRGSQKMEALGTLAGGIAHDFANVLATIIGNLELARQDAGPGRAAQESLEEIGKATRRGRALVQQILAFGRRQPLERKLMSPAATVKESARLLRATLPAGMRLNVECAPDAPQILADATQVQQILLNLCSNAWQAILSDNGQGRGRPGAIEIRLEAQVVHQAPEGGPDARLQNERIHLSPGRYACLMVRDNGPGMDAATQRRIFEPFFTTKPIGEGTGLGLAVVHGIVQAHEASIEVQSVPGEGTTFRVCFPAVDAPAVTAPERETESEPQVLSKHGSVAPELHGNGKQVLYIDDDEAIVFLVTRLLERRGYRVSGYTDPREALSVARTQPDRFDLAVSDYNMPGMSGMEVARALREIRADLPIALATGYITDEMRAEAPAAGVCELIYKPDTMEDLCEAVARLGSTVRGNGIARKSIVESSFP